MIKQNTGNKAFFLRESLFINAYALIISNILVAVASYLFWIIAARRFEPEVVGAASAILSAMAVLNTLTSLGLEVGLVRFIPSISEPAENASLIAFSTVVRTVVGVLASIIFLAGLKIWSPGLDVFLIDSKEFILFIFLVLINGLYQLFNSIFVAHRTSQFVSIGSGIYNGLKLGLLLCLPVIYGYQGVLVTVVISLLITVTLASILIQQKYKNDRFDIRRTPKLKEFLSYSSSNQIVELLLGLPQMILPLFVINSLGAEANALFYISWMISSIVRTFSISIAQSTIAEGSSRPENLSKNLWRGLKFSIIITFACSGVLAVLAPWLLSFFGKNYAAGGLAILRWLLVAVIPFSFVILYITAQRVRKNIPYLMLMTIAWFSVSMVGGLSGMKLGGLAGLTTGWVISQIVSFALAVLLYVYETKFQRKEVKV